MIRKLLHRWHAPTPKFWRKVQRVCFAIAAMGPVIATTPNPVPAWIGWTITGAAMFGAFLSEFTHVKPPKTTDNA